MRREAFLALTAVAAGAALLTAVFWVARGVPDLPDCVVELTPAQEREVAAFRRGNAALHLTVAFVLVVAIWRLSAARRGERLPGRATRIGLAAWSALFGAALIAPGVLGNWAVASLLSFVVLPLMVLLMGAAAVLLAYARTERAGALVMLVVVWLALAVALPGHYAAVEYVDAGWCL